MTYIQDQIREAREAIGLTQAEVGKRLGQPQSSVSRIERGGDLRVSTLLEMARILNLEPMLVPKHLIPAVQALTQHAAERGRLESAIESAASLVGGVPEDAEEEDN
jgi:transcriptional regulator with XRE-family HTH domain